MQLFWLQYDDGCLYRCLNGEWRWYISKFVRKFSLCYWKLNFILKIFIKRYFSLFYTDDWLQWKGHTFFALSICEIHRPMTSKTALASWMCMNRMVLNWVAVWKLRDPVNSLAENVVFFWKICLMWKLNVNAVLHSVLLYFLCIFTGFFSWLNQTLNNIPMDGGVWYWAISLFLPFFLLRFCQFRFLYSCVSFLDCSFSANSAQHQHPFIHPLMIHLSKWSMPQWRSYYFHFE